MNVEGRVSCETRPFLTMVGRKLEANADVDARVTMAGDRWSLIGKDVGTVGTGVGIGWDVADEGGASDSRFAVIEDVKHFAAEVHIPAFVQLEAALDIHIPLLKAGGFKQVTGDDVGGPGSVGRNDPMHLGGADRFAGVVGIPQRGSRA